MAVAEDPCRAGDTSTAPPHRRKRKHVVTADDDDPPAALDGEIAAQSGARDRCLGGTTKCMMNSQEPNKSSTAAPRELLSATKSQVTAATSHHSAVSAFETEGQEAQAPANAATAVVDLFSDSSSPPAKKRRKKRAVNLGHRDAVHEDFSIRASQGGARYSSQRLGTDDKHNKAPLDVDNSGSETSGGRRKPRRKKRTSIELIEKYLSEDDKKNDSLLTEKVKELKVSAAASDDLDFFEDQNEDGNDSDEFEQRGINRGRRRKSTEDDYADDYIDDSAIWAQLRNATRSKPINPTQAAAREMARCRRDRDAIEQLEEQMGVKTRRGGKKKAKAKKHKGKKNERKSDITVVINSQSNEGMGEETLEVKGGALDCAPSSASPDMGVETIPRKSRDKESKSSKNAGRKSRRPHGGEKNLSSLDQALNAVDPAAPNNSAAASAKSSTPGAARDPLTWSGNASAAEESGGNVAHIRSEEPAGGGDGQELNGSESVDESSDGDDSCNSESDYEGGQKIFDSDDCSGNDYDSDDSEEVARLQNEYEKYKKKLDESIDEYQRRRAALENDLAEHRSEAEKRYLLRILYFASPNLPIWSSRAARDDPDLYGKDRSVVDVPVLLRLGPNMTTEQLAFELWGYRSEKELDRRLPEVPSGTLSDKATQLRAVELQTELHKRSETAQSLCATAGLTEVSVEPPVQRKKFRIKQAAAYNRLAAAFPKATQEIGELIAVTESDKQEVDWVINSVFGGGEAEILAGEGGVVGEEDEEEETAEIDTAVLSGEPVTHAQWIPRTEDADNGEERPIIDATAEMSATRGESKTTKGNDHQNTTSTAAGPVVTTTDNPQEEEADQAFSMSSAYGFGSRSTTIERQPTSPQAHGNDNGACIGNADCSDDVIDTFLIDSAELPPTSSLKRAILSGDAAESTDQARLSADDTSPAAQKTTETAEASISSIVEEDFVIDSSRSIDSVLTGGQFQEQTTATQPPDHTESGFVSDLNNTSQFEPRRSSSKKDRAKVSLDQAELDRRRAKKRAVQKFFEEEASDSDEEEAMAAVGPEGVGRTTIDESDEEEIMDAEQLAEAVGDGFITTEKVAKDSANQTQAVAILRRMQDEKAAEATYKQLFTLEGLEEKRRSRGFDAGLFGSGDGEEDKLLAEERAGRRQAAKERAWMSSDESDREEEDKDEDENDLEGYGDEDEVQAWSDDGGYGDETDCPGGEFATRPEENQPPNNRSIKRRPLDGRRSGSAKRGGAKGSEHHLISAAAVKGGLKPKMPQRELSALAALRSASMGAGTAAGNGGNSSEGKGSTLTSNSRNASAVAIAGTAAAAQKQSIAYDAKTLSELASLLHEEDE